MTRTYSLALAVVIVAVVAFAGIALAATGPVGYWALDEGAGTTADDSTANNNDGAISGSAYVVGAPTPGNAFALTFDGIDDYVQIPDAAALDVTGALSISAWIKTSNAGTQILARKTFAYELFVYNGHIAALLGDGTTWSGADIVEGAANIADGSWHHVTMTYDDASNTLNLYVDGVLDVTNAAYPVSLGANSYDLYFGAWNDGTGSGFYFAGDLDEVEIYDRILDAGEISTLAATSTTLLVDDDGQTGFGSIDCDGVGVGAYTAVQDAIGDASAGDTIYVCPGTYVESGQVFIDEDLTIQGDPASKPVIQPASDMIGTNAPDAWFLVDAGVAFSLNDVVLDGDTKFVYQALRSHGNTTVDAVDFMNIRGSASGSPYRGIGVSSYGGTVAGGAGNDSHGAGGAASHLALTNSTFLNIGRIGVLVKGADSTADISGNTYTGKGAGDWLDYGFEAGAGGSMTVENNTVSGNVGVASDGSTSAGILATTYYGAGTSALIQYNNLTGNTEGIAVGYDAADTSDVEAHRNNISSNATAGVSTTNGPQVDATCNWWGDASGPSGGGPGTGDAVVGDVVFTPWLTTSDLAGPCNGPLTTLTVVKVVTNDNGGLKVVADFPLFIDGFPVTSGVASTTSPGAHTVSETSQAGYTAGIWEGDCAADGTITLALGENKTCTITNDDNEPSLTLQKIVVNDNGGGATPAAWTLAAAGLTGFSGAGPIVANGASFDAGTYDLSESGGPAGYTASAWVCIGGSQTDGDTIVIGSGQNVLCTITNDDVPPPVPPPLANACNTPAVAPAGYTLVNGSKASDTIAIAPFTMFVGKGGNDIVSGPAAGNYIVCTEKGNDTITLGNGDFTINAGTGNNIITTGNGSGYIKTDKANDKITTGNGIQTIEAGTGNNTILTGDGDKTVTTGNAIDKITTGSGNDVINAGGGLNTVKSGAGNDTITTGSSNDNIDGGPGTDTCNAGGGINTVVNCAP